MKYAIIDVCGQQMLVEEGKYYLVNRILCKKGSELLLARVLFCNDKGQRYIGYPYIGEKVQVFGTVLGHNKGSKILIFKMIPKKKFRKTKGHRQLQTYISIDSIKTGNVKGYGT